MNASIALPPGVSVFERGWLSSNNILIQDKYAAVLIDSGYCTHAEQTLALLHQRLCGRPLDWLINTHLHSDHCGANAALQKLFPELRTSIPPGLSTQVAQWDATALTYSTTGQQCPAFTFTDVLASEQRLEFGESVWQVHAAPGHDPHAIMLFEPVARILISGDALWERGFGVVFPELEGTQAFSEVGVTLDLIESLKPRTVIPGHGRVFTSVAHSLAWARSRLEGHANHPDRHALYAAKVLIKFRLLELQKIGLQDLISWGRATPYLSLVHERYFDQAPLDSWIHHIVQNLVRSGTATLRDDFVINA